MLKFLLSFLFVFFLVPTIVFADIGVGVGTGKIQVDEKLKPGTIYNLPPLNVVNTGDEASDYEVGISHLEKQEQLFPLLSWFVFTPQRFHLEPGKVQAVSVTLNLPVRTEPGDYFALLEAHPLKKSQTGTTSIGIAAAAKLYFTVIPGSFFEGVYFKALSAWNLYRPWPQRAATAFGILIALFVFKRFFNIQLSTKKPHKEQQQDTHE